MSADSSAALVTVYVVGWLLDIQQKAAGAAELYGLDAFRWALSFQFVMLLGGSIGMLVTRNKARRAMEARGEYTPRNSRRLRKGTGGH